MPKSDTLCSPLQASLILRVSTRTVARWADPPEPLLAVAEYTPGGQRRFLLSDVERLAAEREQAAA